MARNPKIWAAVMIAMSAPLMAQEATTKPDCFCTDGTGERVELGVVICMEVDDRIFAARCEMAQNNPFWREVEGGCVS